ncbi:MAG TPA: ester cyclase [Nocardioidaceae bacterium]|nr:ester cyclase [Nocardioidaceae bacterium]
MDVPEHHKRQVRRFYDDIWNRVDLAAIPDVLAPEVTFRGSLGPVLTGPEEFAGYVREVTTALGDYRCEIESILAEAHRVAARMTFSGVHRGRLLDVPATGRRVSWAGAAFFTFADGLITDLWVLGDVDSLRRQLTHTR